MFRFMFVAPVLALLMVPALARAEFQQGDWALTLSGQAGNGPDFNGSTIGVNGSIGYFFTKEIEGAVRQTISYTDLQGADGSSLNGSTRVAVDYHFDLGRWQPFVGANIGYVYGDSVNDSFLAAPEAGVKFFVNSTTFIVAMVEYQFFFDQGDDTSNAFSDGQFLYTLGIGFRF